MMSDPVRADEHGKPLNDTWSDYNRAHQWHTEGRVVEDLYPKREDNFRLNIRCWRCGQTRKVFHEVMHDMDLPALKWGCPRVPLWYRFKLWRQGTTVPRWDVNTKPPWVSR